MGEQRGDGGRAVGRWRQASLSASSQFARVAKGVDLDPLQATARELEPHSWQATISALGWHACSTPPCHTSPGGQRITHRANDPRRGSCLLGSPLDTQRATGTRRVSAATVCPSPGCASMCCDTRACSSRQGAQVSASGSRVCCTLGPGPCLPAARRVCVCVCARVFPQSLIAPSPGTRVHRNSLAAV